MTLQVILGNTLVLVGAGLVATAGIGLLRLPDVYNRSNAVAKAASLGVVCVLLGVLVLQPSITNLLLVGLAAVLQLVTAPIAGYALGRAAYRSGAPLASSTYRNDLAGSTD